MAKTLKDERLENILEDQIINTRNLLKAGWEHYRTSCGNDTLNEEIFVHICTGTMIATGEFLFESMNGTDDEPLTIKTMAREFAQVFVEEIDKRVNERLN